MCLWKRIERISTFYLKLTKARDKTKYEKRSKQQLEGKPKENENFSAFSCCSRRLEFSLTIFFLFCWQFNSAECQRFRRRKLEKGPEMPSLGFNENVVKFQFVQFSIAKMSRGLPARMLEIKLEVPKKNKISIRKRKRSFVKAT